MNSNSRVRLEVSPPRTLLGKGRGIDHVVLGVRSLGTSRKEYETALGFNMPTGGKHPWGTENAVARFEDDSYLELLGGYDLAKAVDLASFLEKREGGMSLGLNTSSAQQTAGFLRARGLEVESGSGTITLEGTQETPPVLWRSVSLKPGMPLSDEIFFIEYTEEREAFRRSHPEHYGAGTRVHRNTARKMASIWMAVRDVEKSAQGFETVGFQAKRELGFPQMNARGKEFEAGQGTIILLTPTNPEGKTGEFLAQRGEGIMGCSIQVNNLATTQRILEEYQGEGFRRRPGIHGESVLVPPELTHGLWIEFFH